MNNYIEPVMKDDAPYGEVCPVCGETIIERCRCPFAHSRCGNDHRWHYVGKSIVVDKGDVKEIT